MGHQKPCEIPIFKIIKGLAIDYNGQPTYIIQANGVTPSGTSKYVSGGDASTTEFGMTFDSGALVA